MALPFSGRGFAIDKPAGLPCPNLAADHRCTIHHRLDAEGWRGCTVFDCAGAGQRVTEAFASRGGWRHSPGPVFAAFTVTLTLHELLQHLYTAHDLIADGDAGDLALRVGAQIRAVDAATHRTLAGGGAPGAGLVTETASLLNDVAVWQRAGAVLSASARALSRQAPGADLVAARLRGADLRFADLRGACLIAADLRDADLRGAMLLGADLRDARLRGARLEGALFTTTRQLRAAITLPG